MSTAIVSKPAEVEPIARPKRKGRKSHESEASTTRFFMGDAGTDGISLHREFKNEVEAQLESLKLNQPYHAVESWKAVADLSKGSIAVEKRAFNSKT
jgi:hypothetical protein